MSDLPIPFTAAMVQSILREIENPGTGKTQTRRGLVLRGYPKFTSFGRSDTRGYDWHLRDWEMRWHDLEHSRLLSLLPYKVGDRLYVREAWRVSERWDSTRPRDLKPRSMTVFFEAGGSICNQEARDDWRPSSWPEQGFAPNWGGKLRPPMFMPKWASRITLTVTDVRVERLRSITEEDAKAEGVEEQYCEGFGADFEGFWGFKDYGSSIGSEVPFNHARPSFKSLWDSINGSRGLDWNSNPWVIAYTFKPELGHIDCLGASDG